MVKFPVMKKFAFLLFGFLSISAFTQNSERFSIDYEDEEYLQMTDVCYLNNGSYVVAMVTSDGMTGYSTNLLLCMDENNNILWQKAMRISLIDSLNLLGVPSIVSDGIDIYSCSRHYPDGSILLSRISSTGNEIWSKKIVPDTSYGIYPIKMSFSNNAIYIMADVSSTGDYFHAIFKVDATGTLEWSSRLGYPAKKNPLYDLAVMDDGSVIGSGKVNSDMLIFELNPDGSKKWVNRFIENDLFYTQLWKLIPFNNNQQILTTGFRMDYNLMDWYCFYSIVDTMGNIQSMYRLANEYGNPIKFLVNGSNVSITSYNDSLYLYYLLDLNSQGELIRARSKQMDNMFILNLSISPDQTYTLLLETADSLFMSYQNEISRDNADLNSCLDFTDETPVNIDLDYSSVAISDGSTFSSYPASIQSYSIIMTDVSFTKQTLCLSEVGIEINAQFEVEVYPNPCADVLMIKSDHPIDLIEIYSAEGKLILQQNSTLPTQTFDVSGYASGIYFIKISSGNFSSTKKFIKP